MTTYPYASSFSSAGAGVNGLTVSAYDVSRFESQPAFNDDPPDGDPDATTTTGTSAGFDGAFTIGLPTGDRFYLAIVNDGSTYWIGPVVGASSPGWNVVFNSEDTYDAVVDDFVQTTDGTTVNLGAAQYGDQIGVQVYGGTCTVVDTVNSISWSLVGPDFPAGVVFIQMPPGADTPEPGGYWFPIFPNFNGDVESVFDDVLGIGQVAVIAIQGFPVSTATPATDDVMAWNGSEWAPTSPAAASGAMPIANATGISTGTETPDSLSGSDAAEWVEFPAYQTAMAWGLAGDDFPRVVFGSDPNAGLLFVGDGTYDPYDAGPSLEFSAGANTGPVFALSNTSGSVGAKLGLGVVSNNTPDEGLSQGAEVGDVALGAGLFAGVTGVVGGLSVCQVAGGPGEATWIQALVIAGGDPRTAGAVAPYRGILWQDYGDGVWWTSVGSDDATEWVLIGQRAAKFVFAAQMIPADGTSIPLQWEISVPSDPVALTSGSALDTISAGPLVFGAGAIVLQGPSFSVAIPVSEEDTFDVSLNIYIADLLGTQVATLIGSTSIAEGDTTATLETTSLTFTPVVGADLAWDGPAGNLTSTAGGTYLVIITAAGGWD